MEEVADKEILGKDQTKTGRVEMVKFNIYNIFMNKYIGPKTFLLPHPVHIFITHLWPFHSC